MVENLITGKKTLPVLYGLSKSGKFAERWNQGTIHQQELEEIICILETEGAKEFTQAKANELISQALSNLDEAHPTGTASQILKNLALNLIHRQI